MARKYEQSKRDRADEAEGMQGLRTDAYRRITGEGDMSYMIHEDHNAVANLPQHPVMKEYPKGAYGNRYYLDDTIEGIDDTLRDSAKVIDRHMSEEMY